MINCIELCVTVFESLIIFHGGEKNVREKLKYLKLETNHNLNDHMKKNTNHNFNVDFTVSGFCNDM